MLTTPYCLKVGIRIILAIYLPLKGSELNYGTSPKGQLHTSLPYNAARALVTDSYYFTWINNAIVIYSDSAKSQIIEFLGRAPSAAEDRRFSAIIAVTIRDVIDKDNLIAIEAHTIALNFNESELRDIVDRTHQSAFFNKAVNRAPTSAQWALVLRLHGDSIRNALRTAVADWNLPSGSASNGQPESGPLKEAEAGKISKDPTKTPRWTIGHWFSNPAGLYQYIEAQQGSSTITCRLDLRREGSLVVRWEDGTKASNSPNSRTYVYRTAEAQGKWNFEGKYIRIKLLTGNIFSEKYASDFIVYKEGDDLIEVDGFQRRYVRQ